MEHPNEQEIPYTLYLKFKEPADAMVLSNVFEFLGLGFLGEDPIAGTFKIQHYHFKNDDSKKILLHVEAEDNFSERITVSIYSGATIESINALFAFFKDNFEEDEVALIDQQIKNELFLKAQPAPEPGEEEQEEHWITNVEQQARLSFLFDDFYSNALQLSARSAILQKN